MSLVSMCIIFYLTAESKRIKIFKIILLYLILTNNIE